MTNLSWVAARRGTGMACLLAIALAASAARAAGTPAPAAPASSDDVKTLYNEGSAQYALGHFKDALADFEKVYLMKRLPALLFNIAQCHRQMKNFEEAAVTFRSFIRLAPDSPQVGNARELLSQVEEAIRAQRAAQTTPPLDQNGRDVSMNLATPPIPSNLNAAMIPSADGELRAHPARAGRCFQRGTRRSRQDCDARRRAARYRRVQVQLSRRGRQRRRASRRFERRP